MEALLGVAAALAYWDGLLPPVRSCAFIFLMLTVPFNFLPHLGVIFVC